MDDHILAIHEHPAVRRVPFDPGRLEPVRLPGRLRHGVHQRLQLAFAGSGTDYKIVREQAVPLHVEEHDVFGLLVLERVDE